MAFLALVALRLGIGFHFFTEGANKLRNPSAYSAGFLANAKGPWAPLFHSLVYDADGLARLETNDTGEPEALLILGQFHEHAVRHYGFDDAQVERAKQMLDLRTDQLKVWLTQIAPELEQYQLGLERRNAYQSDRARMQVAALHGQVGTIRSELSSKQRELVGPIDRLWKDYEADVFGVATPEQRERGRLSLPKPGRRVLDSVSIDHVIRYFDVAIGGLLIVGLFTRLAAVLGAAFLCSVIASQWPGAEGAVSVWPQSIEALGLIVLAATGAGRFGGLDYLLGGLRRWCCPPNSGTSS